MLLLLNIFHFLECRYHRSLEDSVAQHLPGNNIINSMCCSLEDVYNLTHSAIARVGEVYRLFPCSVVYIYLYYYLHSETLTISAKIAVLYADK